VKLLEKCEELGFPMLSAPLLPTRLASLTSNCGSRAVLALFDIPIDARVKDPHTGGDDRVWLPFCRV
jgi:hypothetical protein